MVFSLFRKTDKVVETAEPDAKESVAKKSRSRTRHKEGRRAAQEAARLTAEKIDQIESEMIDDGDPLSLTSEELSASADAPAAAKDPGAKKGSKKTRRAEITARSANDVMNLVDSADSADSAESTIAGLDFDVSADSQFSIEKTNERGVVPGSAGPAIDITDGALPGELEEAAILYSNGENQIAEGALLDCLERNSTEPKYRSMTWYMIFDLYRATGDRDAFERVALQYADETESSPPTWTDDLAAPEEKSGPKPGASPAKSAFSNVITDEEATKVTNQLIRAASHKRDCTIDFSVVNGLSEFAAAELQRLFDEFTHNKHQIKVIDIDMLITAVKSNTEVERAENTESYWKLAMTCLKIMDLKDEFDDTSIDYCVTFEISPPPWEPYLGDVVLLTSQEAGLDPVEIDTVAVDGEASPEDYVVFQGDLCGKIDQQRAQIQQVSERNSVVRIDCTTLRRMDFTAAGELLNEQLALQNNQRKLHFQHPNYLVFALMHVMGMHEFGEITPRPL